MLRTYKKNFYIILFLSFKFLLAAGAEPIYGKYNGFIDVSSTSTAQQIVLRLGGIIQLTNLDPAFVDGVEINLEMPGGLKSYGSLLALCGYHNVQPDLVLGQAKKYDGERLFLSTIPSGNNISYLLPFTAEASKRGAGYYLLKILDRQKLPLTLILLPMGKVLPTAVYDDIIVTIKPHLREQAIVQLQVEGAIADEVYSLFIDGIAFPWPAESYKLKPGLHKFRLSSSGQIAENSMLIEPRTTQSVQLKLRSKVSTISFKLPESAELLVDGKKIYDFSKDLELGAGNHNIIVIYNGERIQRDVYLDSGESLDFSLVWDLDVQTSSLN